jgi:hypothetical protein
VQRVFRRSPPFEHLGPARAPTSLLVAEARTVEVFAAAELDRALDAVATL